MKTTDYEVKPTIKKPPRGGKLTISKWVVRNIIHCGDESTANWIAAMAEKIKGMTDEEARLEEIRVLSRLATLLAEHREAHGAKKPGDAAGFNPRYAKLPLLDVIPEYLATCKKPQTTKQIAVALKAAGREFESKMEVRAVRDALKKLLVSNEDIFHLGWSKWHLKSKYSKAKREKLLASVHNGTGGRSAKEHGERTKAALAKRRAAGKRMGAVRKLTPEVIEQIKEMLGQPGSKLGDVARHFRIAPTSIWGNGISKRDCRKAAKLKAESENTGGGHVRLVASNE